MCPPLLLYTTPFTSDIEQLSSGGSGSDTQLADYNIYLHFPSLQLSAPTIQPQYCQALILVIVIVLDFSLTLVTVMDCHGISWTVMDCHGLSWTVMYCHVLSWTIMDYHGLPGTARDCHGLSWTVMGCRGLSWTEMD